MKKDAHFGSVTTEELANGYCVAVGNAYRLIEDAERLYDKKRILSVAGLLAMATRDLAKARLIETAAAYQENQEDAWALFWRRFQDPSALMDFFRESVHPHVFKNEVDAQRAEGLIENVKRDFFSTNVDPESKTFLPPGQRAFEGHDEKTFSKRLYEYALAVCKAMNIHGMPDPVSQYKMFRFIKETAQS